jgi:hypothetical protein|tara:strand:- start:48 stop:752 length:705 start_codon:yes stop_codon:yes gene_type:complete
MKHFNKLFFTMLVVFAFSMTSSKAWIADVYSVEGMDAQTLSEATQAYKEKALAAGAKMKNIRSASKIRGDGNGELTTVLVYYETFEDMMHDVTLNIQNPDLLASTYGEVNQNARTDSFIMANDSPMPEGGGPGQAVAYAMVEVTSGINFLLNMPKFREIMQEAGAKIIVDSMNCAMCGESVLPANAMIYFAAANPQDMGEAMDIFSSNEIQRWFFANMAPHINVIDGGINLYSN